jgi:hypothetical protein
MTENVGVPETTKGPCPTGYGNYGGVQVDMHDTIGVIALAIVAVLLLRALLQEQGRNRALTERLVLQ